MARTRPRLASDCEYKCEGTRKKMPREICYATRDLLHKMTIACGNTWTRPCCEGVHGGYAQIYRYFTVWLSEWLLTLTMPRPLPHLPRTTWHKCPPACIRPYTRAH